MKTSKSHVIPILISTFSLWTLLNVLSQPYEIYSILSIIIGLTGVALFYRDNKTFDKFFYLWVYMQIPNITYSEFHVMSSFPLSLGLGLGLGLKNNNTLELYFNALPIGLYFLIKYLNADKPLGTKISIGRLRKGSFPKIQFPISGTIEKVNGRNKMTAVYQVNLDNEIQIKDKSYKYILLEPKNDSLIQVTNKRQIAGLRLCNAPDVHYNNKQNPFVDWVTIDCV